VGVAAAVEDTAAAAEDTAASAEDTAAAAEDTAAAVEEAPAAEGTDAGEDIRLLHLLLVNIAFFT
jgi:hypothetical protein